MLGSVCVEPFGPGNMAVENEGCGKKAGADLPECALAHDLEQPEVEESDFAVKVNRLRATTNSPHGVVKGERDRFEAAAVVRKGSRLGH